MKYTAEEVRALAGDYLDASIVAEMLNYYADLLERIKADEAKALGTCPKHGVEYVGECSRCAMTLPEKDFTHPPAQAAQVDQVGELLAIIHGDGGHYRAEHGTEKAAADAIPKVYALMQKLAKQPAELVQGQPATPILNIRCESVVPNGVKGSTYLPVVRVEAEDDGSFTAVTNYWPAN